MLCLNHLADAFTNGVVYCIMFCFSTRVSLFRPPYRFHLRDFAPTIIRLSDFSFPPHLNFFFRVIRVNCLTAKLKEWTDSLMLSKREVAAVSPQQIKSRGSPFRASLDCFYGAVAAAQCCDREKKGVISSGCLTFCLHVDAIANIVVFFLYVCFFCD